MTLDTLTSSIPDQTSDLQDKSQGSQAGQIDLVTEVIPVAVAQDNINLSYYVPAAMPEVTTTTSSVKNVTNETQKVALRQMWAMKPKENKQKFSSKVLN